MEDPHWHLGRRRGLVPLKAQLFEPPKMDQLRWHRPTVQRLNENVWWAVLVNQYVVIDKRRRGIDPLRRDCQ